MIFNQAENYWNAIADSIEELRPSRIIITTYSYYSAIQNWKRPGLPPHMNGVQRTLTASRCAKACLVIIGNNSANIDKDIEKWPHVRWRHHPKMHSKSTMLFCDAVDCQVKAWVGGINMTLSDYHDIGVSLSDRNDVDWLRQYLSCICDEMVDYTYHPKSDQS